jgi:hypothetical protein
MPEPLTRRSLLTRASIGAAGLAVTVAGANPLTHLLSANPARTKSLASAFAPAEPEPDLTPAGDDVVAHVRNASTGEISIMVGTSEIVYHDRTLVARLLSGARRATAEA